MCGIAGFVTTAFNDAPADLKWFDMLAEQAAGAPAGNAGAGALTETLQQLESRFVELMSLSTIATVARDSAAAKTVNDFADTLSEREAEMTALSVAGQTELDPLVEGLRDYGWQLKAEVGEHAAMSKALLGGAPDVGHALKVAIATEYVLRAIDKLEVRGRDSAGIAVQISVAPADVDALDSTQAAQFAERRKALHADHLSVYSDEQPDGTVTLTFVYKTANLVGRLGDNGAALRGAIKTDGLLWALAAKAIQASILSHTRWASHGVISVANCHPHNPSLTADGETTAEVALGAMYALNGDVDNHMELHAELVASRQLAVDASITTDAKIIPIAHRSVRADGADPLERFRAAIRRLDGSVAIGCIDPAMPGETYLAQKGSGQGLHAARLADGWMFASEVYGLCNAARTSYNLARSVAGGTVIHLSAERDTIDARSVTDGAAVTLKPEPIQIFARDIFRANFETFLEKEIHDGPGSVAKTLKGRYRKQQDGLIAFDKLTTDIWQPLREHLAKGISRIYVIGQGTAGVAAVGIGELIERAIARDARVRIPVLAVRSSELSADIESYDFDRALMIAVSQSGTTTDTNRAVDLARERGAFVHAIVNRRNSDLVRKSDSVLFTSDGRDVEMSVASTKAFYSQITAGKLTALFIAERLKTMTEVELAYEMSELEALPGHIERVLENRPAIEECARSLAPFARYWAVTGSGTNHIAALEIRIKLSELCYKSIPVDYTEDKKHIDLSTEPLTLVIANDLPGDLVSDVVKEAAIFKAHNGRPVVFATEGADADAFGDNAERVIGLPKIGADLAFVLATVAGHLFGFFAAKAIDEGAQKLKAINLHLGSVAMGDIDGALSPLLDGLNAFVDEASRGAFNSGLGASDLAHVAKVARELTAARDDRAALIRAAEAAIAPMQKAFEETSRPVDTIRHQAKTVTVGTSRPEDALSVTIRDALAGLGVADSRMRFDDRKMLASVSRLIESVNWATMLKLEGGPGSNRTVEAGDAPLPEALASYKSPSAPLGIIGSAVDANAMRTGFIGQDAVLVVPVNGLSFNGTEYLFCASVKLVAHATREQKTAVMNALGTYKPRLREWEEVFGEAAEGELQRAIASADPLQVVFRPQALDPLDVKEPRQSA